jgi:ketosteroid isomerase-like protein
MSQENAHVLTVQDGRVTRTEVFLDRHEALEAVGLRE